MKLKRPLFTCSVCEYYSWPVAEHNGSLYDLNKQFHNHKAKLEMKVLMTITMKLHNNNAMNAKSDKRNSIVIPKIQDYTDKITKFVNNNQFFKINTNQFVKIKTLLTYSKILLGK
jgi:hypothetical protein